ncbi:MULTISPECIES: VOC family protein [unclassified Streptomyces]|uniref:VOC family protein n=1 Tax=unclassified Streptomyces TaxID=2593676 RepID=UPI0022389FB4|nr:VOC family protein [Streptomyces sp. SHP 1-2]MCW5250235.1 VOC family protein [Streptomyces sp. SHP 1-2]
MAAPTEGAPCWADVMCGDVEGAKAFYGAVLGWTFRDVPTEFGDYTQAYAGDSAVAAVVPPAPGHEVARWCLYLASPDAAATAERVRGAGGEVLAEPMRVDGFGTMCLARDPGGVVFGVWQPGSHEGFGAVGVPGAFCWAEVFTRDPAAADAFFPAVFPYTTRRMEDAGMDFRVYDTKDGTVLGRMAMTDDFPPGMPSFVNVYFTVDDCDAAVSRATERGGTLRSGPMDSPFGRFAALGDPQGAHFSVIDVTRTRGEMPTLGEVS